jgi:hypothetical protein
MKVTAGISWKDNLPGLYIGVHPARQQAGSIAV